MSTQDVTVPEPQGSECVPRQGLGVLRVRRRREPALDVGLPPVRKGEPEPQHPPRCPHQVRKRVAAGAAAHLMVRSRPARSARRCPDYPPGHNTEKGSTRTKLTAPDRIHGRQWLGAPGRQADPKASPSGRTTSRPRWLHAANDMHVRWAYLFGGLPVYGSTTHVMVFSDGDAR